MTENIRRDSYNRWDADVSHQTTAEIGISNLSECNLDGEVYLASLFNWTPEKRIESARIFERLELAVGGDVHLGDFTFLCPDPAPKEWQELMARLPQKDQTRVENALKPLAQHGFTVGGVRKILGEGEISSKQRGIGPKTEAVLNEIFIPKENK